MQSAVFLYDCDTVHEYRDKIKALSQSDETYLNDSFLEYEVAECFLMKYENFIYLCNHINERFEKVKHSWIGGLTCRVTMFYCYRADKVLLLSFADRRIAVLYNAGTKVDIRPNNHRARAARNAEKKRLRLLQKTMNAISSSIGEDVMELLNNLEKIHTTQMGADRIKKNLSLNDDVVVWCRNQTILSKNIVRQGKNWYVHTEDAVITINAHSYTIITAHKKG